MTEKTESKVEALPDLDDLLQCPVCYEIPSGQIFQCDQGHHVCGRCKMRLDICPVCRAFFFGTRNYAMEELIANVRKLQAFKLGGKVTTGSPPEEVNNEGGESTSSDENISANVNENEDDDLSSQTSERRPVACKGLFRCLCCKNNPERLPSARLLNHLRYFHSPDLIEGRSDNGEYLQAWQFPTEAGRIVTAVRVADMGIFFLIIEITRESVYAWLSMASSPRVAQEFSYTFTLSGNDREAIFTDCVWSVRSCEGSLKKRGRCLSVSGQDARALLAPTAMNGKLSVRRTPLELLPQQAQPRAVLRVANRSRAPPDVDAHDLEPFLQDLQNDVARLSRAFATLGREANALVRTEAEMRARLEQPQPERVPEPAPADAAPPAGTPAEHAERTHLSRNARRRMRQRLRDAFRETQASEPAARADSDRVAPAAAPAHVPPAAAPTASASQGNRLVAANGDLTTNTGRSHPSQSVLNRTPNNQVGSNERMSNNNQTPSILRATGQMSNLVRGSNGQAADNIARTNGNNNPRAPNSQNGNDSVNRVAVNVPRAQAGAGGAARAPPRGAAAVHLLAAVAQPPVPPPTFEGPSNGTATGGNTARNKKKRRHRR